MSTAKIGWQVVRLGLAADPVIVIAGLSNDYADYTTTYDEYQEQRCDASASTAASQPLSTNARPCAMPCRVRCPAVRHRYEGGSTTYGPWEHEAFTHELIRLVRDMASGTPSATLPPPQTDLSKMVELQVPSEHTRSCITHEHPRVP
jgi:hypothetical protein